MCHPAGQTRLPDAKSFGDGNDGSSSLAAPVRPNVKSEDSSPPHWLFDALPEVLAEPNPPRVLVKGTQIRSYQLRAEELYEAEMLEAFKRFVRKWVEVYAQSLLDPVAPSGERAKVFCAALVVCAV